MPAPLRRGATPLGRPASSALAACSQGGEGGRSVRGVTSLSLDLSVSLSRSLGLSVSVSLSLQRLWGWGGEVGFKSWGLSRGVTSLYFFRSFALSQPLCPYVSMSLCVSLTLSSSLSLSLSFSLGLCLSRSLALTRSPSLSLSLSLLPTPLFLSLTHSLSRAALRKGARPLKTPASATSLACWGFQSGI